MGRAALESTSTDSSEKIVGYVSLKRLESLAYKVVIMLDNNMPFWSKHDDGKNGKS